MAAGVLLPRVGSAEKLGEQPELTGKFKVVTYNVAGLPEGISDSHPSVNMPRIGELLNEYDLALVQEDFAYPLELRRAIRHPYKTAAFIRGDRIDFGDGLSQFTRTPFSGVVRQAWAICNGYLSDGCDCLTPKGFTFARHELSPDQFVDVYNLHMDSGDSEQDRAARVAQLEQLSTAISTYSVGQALIVAGDTNMELSEASVLRKFNKRTGLEDVCRKMACREPERIDRVFFRNSAAIDLRPLSWRTDRRFVDANSLPLSDHLPVAVVFEWKVVPRAVATPKPATKKQRGSLATRQGDELRKAQLKRRSSG